MSIVAEKLITLEEYEKQSDDDGPTELVRGRIIHLNRPSPRHGKVCVKIARLVGNYIDERKLGHFVGNDSGVVTQRNPDTVRGPDVAYFSFARLPEGPIPDGYLSVVPDLVFEVRSASDRWLNVLGKVSEYLDAGVSVVCVLDPEPQTIHIFRADQPVQVLNEDEDFAVPELLGDFRVPVRKFYE